MKPSDRERLNRTRFTASVPNKESDHFVTCPDCGRTIDCRKLGDVLDHEERCDGPKRRDA